MINKEKILGLLESEELDADFFLVDMNIGRANDIKIFIDHKEGISIQECVKVSRFVEHSLLEEDEDLDFSLEVSSAGLDMPLKVEEQYEKNLGKEIEVLGTDGVKTTGRLSSFNENELVLEELPPAKKKGPGSKSRKKVQDKRTDEKIKEFKLLRNNIKSVKILVSI